MRDDIFEIAGATFTGMLGLAILPRLVDPATPEAATAVLEVRLGLTGAWSGEVRIACTAAAATLYAMRLRGVSGPSEGEPAPDDAETRDALAELANIVAGNVKRLLPSPTRIAVPATIELSTLSRSAASVPRSHSVAFACEGVREPTLVAVWPAAGEA